MKLHIYFIVFVVKFYPFCSEIRSIQLEGNNLVVGFERGFVVYDVYSRGLKYSYYGGAGFNLVLYDFYTGSYFFVRSDSVYCMWGPDKKPRFVLFKKGISSIGVDSRFLYIEAGGRIYRYYKNGLYYSAVGGGFAGVVWVGKKSFKDRRDYPWLAPWFYFGEKYILFYPFREKLFVGTDKGRVLVFNCLLRQRIDSFEICKSPFSYWGIEERPNLSFGNISFAFRYSSSVFIFCKGYFYWGNNFLNLNRKFLNVQVSGFVKIGENFYFYGGDGVFRFNPENKEFEKILELSVKDMAGSGNAIYLVDAGGKVLEYNLVKGNGKILEDEKGWLREAVDVLFDGRDVWFLTKRGILRYSNSGFYYFPYAFKDVKFFTAVHFDFYVVDGERLLKINLKTGEMREIFNFGIYGIKPFDIRVDGSKVMVLCDGGIVEIR